MKNIILRKTNPYILHYLSFAIICCVLLSVIFLYINYQNVQKIQETYNQEKVELVCKMLEEHLDTQRKTAYQVSKGKVFQPYYYKNQKYYEVELLKAFSEMSTSITLNGLAFLYYDEDRNIYRNDGHLQSLEQYFIEAKYEETQRQQIESALKESGKGFRIYNIEEDIYFMYSIKVNGSLHYVNAVYCFVTSNEEMDKRIQLVSGGMQGNYEIYVDDQILYCKGESISSSKEADGIRAQTQGNGIRIIWLPEQAGFFDNMLPLQILILLSVLIVILILANQFAQKSFYPVRALAEKYHSTIFDIQDQSFHNTLEELDSMIDTVIKSNTDIKEQLLQKQLLLQKQILKMLLNGNYSQDSISGMNQIKMLFPGDYFFVMSILVEEEQSETDYLHTMETQLELISDPQQQKYVEVLCNPNQKAVYVLGAMGESEKYQEFRKEIQEVAESFEWNIKIGCGKAYCDLSKVSASFLESLDNIQKYKGSQTENKGFIYNDAEICLIVEEVALGNEESAKSILHDYVERLREQKISLLMQQYIFSNFISEISRTAFDNQIEMEQSNISLLVSAKSLNNFLEAAEMLVHDICVKINEKQKRLDSDTAYQVYCYMNEHFCDYDISLEKVANDLNSNTAFVRNAVKETTGKSYKNYLIYLRIEYAKELLKKSQLSVAEVCEKVGYGNISYFIKLFRESTGMTPSAWRKGE